jgi:N-acetylmuramoyl-L-alanine amidase
MKIDQSKKFNNFFEKKSQRKIDFIVLHHIESFSSHSAIEDLAKHKVSAHFLIDENGKIFQLVEEIDIAYHAGFSFWKDNWGLNKNSIGIEFFSKNAFEIGFTENQMNSGLELCKYLIKKYQIEKENVVGHCDIAYQPDSFYLNRKQDPSHLFDWQIFLNQKISVDIRDFSFPKNVKFSFGDKDQKILEIKKTLKEIGYLVKNLDENFDEEMKNLTLSFNLHFNQKSFPSGGDVWNI